MMSERKISESVLFCRKYRPSLLSVYACVFTRENKGTERDIKGVGWDMSIPLKLFLVLEGNGNMFPETSARSSNCEFSM